MGSSSVSLDELDQQASVSANSVSLDELDAQSPATLSKSQANAELTRNPLGPGSPGYKAKPAPTQSSKFTDVWFPNGVSTEAQAGAARAASPKAAAEAAAGMPLADVAGKPHDPQLDVPNEYNPKTGMPFKPSLVPDLDAPGFVPGAAVPRLVERTASGLQDMGEAFTPQVNEKTGAYERTPAGDEAKKRQMYQGASDVISGAGGIGMQVAPIAVMNKPVSTIAAMGFGLAASEGSGAIAHRVGASPEAEELTRNVGFFLPSLMGVASGLKTGTAETPAGKFSGASAFGGKVRAGIARTPDVTSGRVKVGDTQFEVNIPRNRPAPVPEPSEAAKALASFEQHTGNPDFQPAPPPPVPPGTNGPEHLTPDVVKGVSDAIMQADPAKRPGLMTEAHGNMVKWMVGRGAFVGPDSKIHTVDSEGQAKKLASKFINDEVDRRDAEADKAAKAAEEAPKAQAAAVSTTAPIAGKPPAAGHMTTDTAAVKKFAAEANIHPEQKPAIAVKKEPPKETAALAQPPEPVKPEDVAKIGKEDKESGRTILQPSDDVMQNERLAAHAAPELATKLSHIAASVEGATFDRLRPQKELERVDEKVDDSGKPPETVPDYLASQIAADSPQAKDQLVAAIKKNFNVIQVEDNFLEGKPELANYRSVNVQVGMENNLTAEVQIVPLEVQETANESHKYYTAGREAELRGDHKEKERQFKKASELHDAAMDRFNRRNALLVSPSGLPGERAVKVATASLGDSKVMMGDVAGSIGKGKVLGPVVGSNLVNVVDNLTGKQGAAENALHNKTVQEHALPIDTESNVPAVYEADTSSVDSASARAVQPSTFRDLTGNGGESAATKNTGSLNSGSSENGTSGTQARGTISRTGARAEPPRAGLPDSLNGKNSAASLTGEHSANISIPHSVPLDELETQPQPERRTNTAERKRVEHLTPEERGHELLTSELTGLPNKRAFAEDAATMAESHPHVGYADIDDFKQFNSILGHEGVDEKVLPEIGEVFRRAIGKEPDGSIKVYHRSGDEFLFRSKDEAAIGRVVDRVNKELETAVFTAESPDGKIHTKQGAGLKNGTGRNAKEAEHNAEFGEHPGSKKSRTAAGLRSGARDIPEPVGGKLAEGEQAGGREGSQSVPLEELEPSPGSPEYETLRQKLAALEKPKPVNTAAQTLRERVATKAKEEAKRIADRLRTVADGLDKQIEDKQRSMTSNPTPKRMREYRSRLHDGENMKRVQQAMRALADAHEAGTVPKGLENLRTKDEVYRLVYKGVEGGGGYYDVIPSQDYANKTPQGKALQELMERHKNEPSEARAERERASKISQLEADVQFQKLPGYFPTPNPVVEKMLDAADIQPGDKVLEPSAGKGNIADLIKEREPEAKLSAIEPQSKLRQILELKGHELADSDFLGHKGEYDKIVMNPPFENGQDIDHVQHAFALLKPGGKLVAIMSESPFFRSDRKGQAFREWLEEHNGTSEKLKPGSFKESGTGVNARMVEIEKPKAKAAAATSDTKEPWQMTRDEFYDPKYNITHTKPETPRHGMKGNIGSGAAELTLPTRETPTMNHLGDYWRVIDPFAAGDKISLFDTSEEAAEYRRNLHGKYVREAAAEGKPVPAEVLKDYPDLKPAAREPISTVKQEAEATQEPWQMTREEWENSPQFKADEDGKFPSHQDIVLDALQRGDAVPPTVKEEYGYEYGKNARDKIRQDQFRKATRKIIDDKLQNPAIAQFDEAVKHTGAEVKEGKPSEALAEKIKEATHLEPVNDAELKEKFTGAAYQREYFKAALGEAKAAWIAAPGSNVEMFEFLAKSNTQYSREEFPAPGQIKTDQLYIKVPGDGHFLVNNTPFAIEKALKGATRGFSAPRASFNPEAKAKKFSAPKATPEAIEKYRKELAEELRSAEGDKSYAESRLKDDKESRAKSRELTDELNADLKKLRASDDPKKGDEERELRDAYNKSMQRLPRQMSEDQIEEAHDTIAQREADIPVLRQNVKDFDEQFPAKAAASKTPATTGLEPGSMRASAFGLDILAKQAGTFFQQDVAPTLKGVAGGLKDVTQRGLRVVAPRAGVPSHLLDTIMRMKGQREEELYRFQRTTEGMKKMFDKLPEEARLSFIDRMMHGQRQPSTELEDVADSIRAIQDRFRDQEKVFKSDLTDKENYFHLKWTKLPQGVDEDGNLVEGTGGERPNTGQGNRPLQGGRSFMKRKTLPDASAGIKRGGELLTTNPIGLLEHRVQESLKFTTARKMWEELKDTPYTVSERGRPMHMVQFFREGQGQQAKALGYEQLNDRIAKVLFPAGSGEGMVHPGEYWVEQNAARLLNNFLSRDLIRESAAGRGIVGLKNATTAWRLAFSPFHALVESIITTGSEVGRGIEHSFNQGLRQGSPTEAARGVGIAAKAPVAPFTAAREGGSAIRYVTSPQEFLATTRGQKFISRYPEAAELVSDLFTGGAKLAMHEDFRVKMVESMRQAMADNNYIGAALRTPGALSQAIQYPLFEVYIPRLKLGMFLREYSEALADREPEIEAGKLTRAKLARETWDNIDYRFGEVNWDNFFFNRTFKTSLQLAFRAFAWRFGNFAFTGSGVTGQARQVAESLKFLKDAATGGESARPGTNAIPKIDPRMAKLLGLAIFGLIAHGMLQWALTREKPKDAKDLIAPRDGTLDSHGHPNRWTLPIVPYRDLESAKSNPMGYLRGGTADIWTAIPEAINNRDFRNHLISHPSDPYWEQMFDKAAHVVGVPIGVDRYRQEKKRGEGTGNALLGEAGLSRATNYELTPAEKKMREIQIAHYGPETDEDLEAREKKDERIAAGRLTSKEMQDKVRSSMKNNFERGMKSFTYEQAKQVYDVASPEEKALMGMMLLRKRFNSRRTAAGELNTQRSVLSDAVNKPIVDAPVIKGVRVDSTDKAFDTFQGRPLNTNELKAISPIFQNLLNLGELRIHDIPAQVLDYVETPGTIGVAVKNRPNDFAVATGVPFGQRGTSEEATVAHEVTHDYQFHGGKFNPKTVFGDGSSPYNYGNIENLKKLRSIGLKFEDMGTEQQARMVEDYINLNRGELKGENRKALIGEQPDFDKYQSVYKEYVLGGLQPYIDDLISSPSYGRTGSSAAKSKLDDAVSTAKSYLREFRKGNFSRLGIF